MRPADQRQPQRGEPSGLPALEGSATRAGAERLRRSKGNPIKAELLSAEFSLQANRKTREGADNPDRDAQFGFINEAVTTAWRRTSRDLR